MVKLQQGADSIAWNCKFLSHEVVEFQNGKGTSCSKIYSNNGSYNKVSNEMIHPSGYCPRLDASSGDQGDGLIKKKKTLTPP